MKTIPFLLCGLLLAACSREAPSAPAPAAGGPPPMPPYQMRAEAPPGDRTKAGRDGEALFSNACGFCHLPGGMGTNLLTAQKIAAGESPALGLLSNRTDLPPDYIIQVVRNGKGAMPPQTRVDVTDTELQSIAKYLAKGNK